MRCGGKSATHHFYQGENTKTFPPRAKTPRTEVTPIYVFGWTVERKTKKKLPMEKSCNEKTDE